MLLVVRKQETGIVTYELVDSRSSSLRNNKRND